MAARTPGHRTATVAAVAAPTKSGNERTRLIRCRRWRWRSIGSTLLVGVAATIIVSIIPNEAACRDAGPAPSEHASGGKSAVAATKKDEPQTVPQARSDAGVPEGASPKVAGGSGPAETPYVRPTDPTGVVFIYAAILGVFVFGLMGWDLKNAYKAATDIRVKLFAQLKDPTPEQLRALAGDLSQSLPGIPGLARSTLALALLLILGIVLFHLITFGAPGFGSGETGKLVHDLAILLGGGLTSVTAFYFGGRAVQEGAAGAAAQPKAPPAIGASVAKLTPDNGTIGADVTISGTGFGPTAGQVKFGSVDAPVASWSDTAIKTKVPTGVTQGSVTVTVNPVGTSAVTGRFTVN